MPESASPLLFPYMVWARDQGWRAAHVLSQSGMPPPEEELLGPRTPGDLEFAGAGALPALQERLAELAGAPPERVLVTVGASGAMHLAALHWFRGARVVSDVPSYEPFRSLPRLVGADPRRVPRRPEDGWRLDPDRVARELAGAGAPRARGHVFTTNTHNPTGASLCPDEVRALAEHAARAGGVLVSCEVYMQFVPPGERTEAWKLAPNAVSIGSLTKAYGLGALRLGWMVLGEELARERERLLDASFLAWVDPPTPALRAGLAALEHLAELRARLDAVARESRPLVARWLAETPHVRADLPPHGIICFPELEGVPDTAAFVAFCQAEHDVTVVPGEFFGAPGHVRLGFGQPPETVAAGLAALTQALEAWRARAS